MARPTDPPELRLLKNDKAHAYRYKDRNEPKPSETKAVAPEYLSERGKEIFEEIVARIEEMYPCSETDTYALVLYAQNQEQLEYLDNFLRINNCTYEVDGLYGPTYKERPESKLLKQCKDYALKVLVEFGLTPSARARVNLKKPEGEGKKTNPFANLGNKASGE